MVRKYFEQMKETAKTGEDNKTLISALTYLSIIIANILFLGGGLTTGLCCYPILRFFLRFPYFLISQVLGRVVNSWGNFHAKFVIFETTLYFACRKLNMCKIVTKFQNFMTTIVGFFVTDLLSLCYPKK